MSRADTNQLAASVVAQATGQAPKVPRKDPQAVARGRKGGVARSEALSPSVRREIAKQARASRKGAA